LNNPHSSKVVASDFGKTTAFWVSLLIILLGASILRSILLDMYIIGSDEAIHMMWLRSLTQGYEPYSEVYITYPPLYPMVLATVWNIWSTESAQHWLSVVYTLLGAIGVALLARKFAGPAAGVVAAILVLFSPVLLAYSIGILGEFPSVTWSIWTILMVWLYRDAQPGSVQEKAYLILSGLCLAASLLTKVLSPFIVGLIPLILVSKVWPYSKEQSLDSKVLALWSKRKVLLVDSLIWGLSFLLPFVIAFWIFDLGPLFQQVVGQRLAARTAYIDGSRYWSSRYVRGTTFIQEDSILVILAVLGLILALIRGRKNLWIILTWFALAIGMLLIHEPLRHKHTVILIPPLAILGGTAIQILWNELGQGQKAPWIYRVLLVGIIALLILFYPRQVQTTLAYWEARSNDPKVANYQAEALAFIEQITTPQDCLITDEMKLVYWANRMAPPELAEVSENRLKSGALSFEELATITDKYDCQVVAPVSDTPRIPKYLPEYIEWVKTKYLGQFEYGRQILYFAKVDTTPRPAMPLSADFAGEIRFYGYTLPPNPVSPGERVPLVMVWQAQTNPDIDYKIFVQLRDLEQVTLASADHEPYLGHVPTSAWPAGAVIQEMNWLELPPEMPPGSYNIYVGLYRPDNLERLPLVNDMSGENALILGPLVVQ
jgi:4-amino-4-deoxy-L-arabinose transferase-like glycosyltransferase